MREGIIRLLGLCKGFIRWELEQDNDLPMGVSQTSLGIKIGRFQYVPTWRVVVILTSESHHEVKYHRKCFWLEETITQRLSYSIVQDHVILHPMEMGFLHAPSKYDNSISHPSRSLAHALGQGFSLRLSSCALSGRIRSEFPLSASLRRIWVTNSMWSYAPQTGVPKDDVSRVASEPTNTSAPQFKAEVIVSFSTIR
jgi:hypothetical protein